MGGRGGSGRSAARSSKPKYFGESDRAVQLRLTVEDYDLEQTRSRTVWVPKSQLADDGRPSNWITQQKAQEFYSGNRAAGSFSATWEDASGKKFGSSATRAEAARAKQRQDRFNAGVQSYNQLVQQAKQMGIKGIRVGMKRKTIEQEIRDHKK